MSKTIMKVRGLSKSFGKRQIFSDVDFEVKEGEKLGIIGYSGCGKTTLLRILGGFEKADSGKVVIAKKRIKKPTKKAIMVFQDFAQLLPWRTVLDNVVWPMMITGVEKDKQKAVKIAKKYLSEMGLSDATFEMHPVQLSGGMKQRVAMARALAMRPKMLLMDEPFGALDNLTRRKMQEITRTACDKHKISAVLVTHSVKEAVMMCDRILVFRAKGKYRIIKSDENAKRRIREMLKI